jgi:hypothetical protein
MPWIDSASAAEYSAVEQANGLNVDVAFFRYGPASIKSAYKPASSKPALQRTSTRTRLIGHSVIPAA